MTNTVFVMGAGASKEVQLPTGYELKSVICRMLDMRWDHWNQISGDHLIVAALRELVKSADGTRGDINPHVHEAWHIRDALPLAISIDNFIDAHRENEKIELCGKLAIVRSILEAEKKSLLYFDGGRGEGLDFSQIEKTWLIPFFHSTTENCGLTDLAERFNQITIIAFNYDRCIEHFLINALVKYYKITEEKAVELIANLSIFHPYGKVGELPWQSPDDSMGFGDAPTGQELLELAQGIKTFTEGTDPGSSDIFQIRQRIENAEKLVFLGFAFHDLNMDLLKPTDLTREDFSGLKCFGSALGISNSDKEVVSEQISVLYKSDIAVNLADLACKDLFIEFRRSLAFR